MSLVPDAGVSRTALRGLVGDGVSDDEARTAYAAAIWSTLVEPGDGTAGALIAHYGAAEALERAVGEATSGLGGGAGVTEEDVRAARARWLPRRGEVDRVLAAARRAGARLLVPGEEVWPRALDDLGVHAPVCLWARGDVRALSSSATLALVGARAATAYGTHVVTELAADSAARGVVVVSGAAYGIDGAAQDSIWVLGYPAEGAHFYTHALPRPLIASRQTEDAQRCVLEMFAAIARRSTHGNSPAQPVAEGTAPRVSPPHSFERAGPPREDDSCLRCHPGSLGNPA